MSRWMDWAAVVAGTVLNASSLMGSVPPLPERALRDELGDVCVCVGGGGGDECFVARGKFAAVLTGVLDKPCVGDLF
jgi:hypothetical protein